MPPTTIHSSKATAGFGTALRTSAGTMKMDAPMVPLTTIITESNSVSWRSSFGSPAAASTRIVFHALSLNSQAPPDRARA